MTIHQSAIPGFILLPSTDDANGLVSVRVSSIDTIMGTWDKFDECIGTRITMQSGLVYSFTSLPCDVEEAILATD